MVGSCRDSHVCRLLSFFFLFFLQSPIAAVANALRDEADIGVITDLLPNVTETDGTKRRSEMVRAPRVACHPSTINPPFPRFANRFEQSAQRLADL